MAQTWEQHTWLRLCAEGCWGLLGLGLLGQARWGGRLLAHRRLLLLRLLSRGRLLDSCSRGLPGSRGLGRLRLLLGLLRLLLLLRGPSGGRRGAAATTRWLLLQRRLVVVVGQAHDGARAWPQAHGRLHGVHEGHLGRAPACCSAWSQWVRHGVAREAWARGREACAGAGPAGCTLQQEQAGLSAHVTLCRQPVPCRRQQCCRCMSVPDDGPLHAPRGRLRVC